MTLHCQRCKQPLRMDDSLSDLDSASADMLIAPLSAEEQHQQQLRSSRTDTPRSKIEENESLHKRVIGKAGKRDSAPLPSESFVVLTRSQVHTPRSSVPSPSPSSTTTATNTNTTHTPSLATSAPSGPASSSPPHHPNDDKQGRNNSLSHRLKVANRLFNIMSSKSSVDHPMCLECTDMLLENLEKQLEDASRERDCYIDFLKKVKDNRITQEEEEDLKRQVHELQLAEEEAQDELDDQRNEYNAVTRELEQLEKEMESLDQEEREYWNQCNQYQIDLQNFQNERDSMNFKYDHDVKQYERLQKTVVYNDAFCIAQEGHFGTINGFRLGRLHSHPVEWNEINAAWGQTLLLLYTVANKLKFEFKTYRLIPMGSFSRVEKHEGDSVISYELYGTGDFALNRMFLNRRFDQAMVAVLNCLKQLTDYAEEKDRSLRFPYRIHRDKIGDLSIRLQFNQSELWTKALKYMLTNMKWVLVFASRANVNTEQD
ncbi:autophagy protein Apg6-domain-containing protein [Syncephalastrum racemosum]|uniref:Autophagy protein Apg6-domain-containing protein n=1 Tax=Syncephalastrum racemosum TaxID=13706 RepID=A0A1X2HV61_SYNRA|nr:autophagy protein Apg6-domain-containing protein [Syncephalastrum racemosum]